MSVAVWKLCGAAFNGYQGNPQAPLGCSYSFGMDGRFNELVLAPLLTSIDLSAAGGTPATVNCGAFSEGISHGTGAEKLLLGRGTQPAIVDLGTRLNVADGTHAALSSAATDMMYSKSDAGTEEISIALASNIFRVVTVVPNTGGYTDSANNENMIWRIFGRGASTSTSIGVAYALGAGTSGVENIIASNILTGATTMDASAFATRSRISGEPITFTAFFPIGDQFGVGTSNGVYLLNDIYQRHEPLMPELDNNALQCVGSFATTVFGAFSPTTTGLRWWPTGSPYSSLSVGPETFRRNTSPIQGRATAGWATTRWVYVPFLDPVTSNTYICAGRTAEEGDWHGNPISWFPLMRLTELTCSFGAFAGTKGSQTQPTHYLGRGSNAGWFIDGIGDNRTLDANATYGASGTLYGTELRLPEGVRITGIDFPAKGLTSAITIAPSITYRDMLGVQKTVAIGPAQTQSGWVHVDVTGNTIPEGVRYFAPQVDFATGTSTLTPSIPDEGYLAITYEKMGSRDTSGRLS